MTTHSFWLCSGRWGCRSENDWRLEIADLKIADQRREVECREPRLTSPQICNHKAYRSAICNRSDMTSDFDRVTAALASRYQGR